MSYKSWAGFTIDGSRYDNATFVNGLGHEPPGTYYTIGGPRSGPRQPPEDRPVVAPDRDSWSVELPVILWMLDQVERGSLTSARMRELLVEATAPVSGCCYACDEVREPEDELLARLARERQEWIAWWNSLTGESHPYVLSSNKIHRWDCRAVGEQPQPPPQYHSKHEYVTRGCLEPEIWTHHKRVTVDEARKWLYQFRRRTYAPRCKVCAPELPGAWRGETSDVASTR